MLVLGRSQVEQVLDMDALIDGLGPAMVDLSEGRASVPDRVAAVVPERDGFLAAMPGYVPSARVLMSKLVSLFPHNAGTPLPTHQALIAVFDPETGRPVALLDGTFITAARTAAASALSARLLAREDAAVLAVLGTGVQARTHARAMCRVRPVRQVRVAGRDAVRAGVVAEELSAELGVEVVAAPHYASALDGADVVAAATHSVDPVVRREWLTPGVHIASVGFNQGGREVDDATVAEALVCVESRRAVLAPFPAGSNDLLFPIRDGVITPEHVHAELGELLNGSRTGRSSADQITLYKSVGVAVQDAAAAALVVAAARERGIGDEIRFA
ncbi:ornithine cyclodeaminase family protein [Streptomyces sp. NRRL S-118]|uniref:ornithine cyclodeaminase family protein n=1 Tax=Streptomyces sp. NRRL S-118 TaxID=1463881 RepID=UPI0004C4AE1B|nr:ornithine cyclodeaminase family protein [Streptomyces sp. NRRL S-118]